MALAQRGTAASLTLSSLVGGTLIMIMCTMSSRADQAAAGRRRNRRGLTGHSLTESVASSGVKCRSDSRHDEPTSCHGIPRLYWDAQRIYLKGRRVVLSRPNIIGNPQIWGSIFRVHL